MNLADSEGQPLLKRQKRMFSWLASKKVPPVPSPDERRTYPNNYANFISRTFFWWLIPMLNVGYKRTLQAEDMYKLNYEQRIEYMYKKFSENLQKTAPKEYAKRQKKASNDERPLQEPIEGSFNQIPVTGMVVARVLLQTFWVEYTIAAIELTVANICSALSPLLQKALTNFVERRVYGLEPSVAKGVGYSIGCCLIVLFDGIFINHFFNRSMSVGAKVRAVLTKAILEKSYRLDSEGHHKFSTSKLTALMGTDLNRVDMALGFFPLGVFAPIPTVISIVLLVINIGVSSLVGIAMFIVSVVSIGLAIKSLLALRTSINKYTDKRVGLTKELVKDFKVIKFYSWEDSYEARIFLTRRKEMSFVYKMQSTRNYFIAYANSLPTISSMLAFCVLYAVDSTRSVGAVFSSLSLFQGLAMQFNLVPLVIATSTDMFVAFGRVAELFSCNEVPIDGIPSKPLDDEKLAIKVVDASFDWDTFEDDPNSDDEEDANKKKKKGHFWSKKKKEVEVDLTKAVTEVDREMASDSDTPTAGASESFQGLHNINLDIRKGEFIVVTGQIGSGKSSLLSALSGFMPKTKGEVYDNGDVLLCGSPWVENTTVRKNILFGSPLNESKYQEVIEACCLEDDLKLLPGGDNTEVGERGVTLSGGQKARLCLARAVYAERDIILLDDVLSAVDAKVGKTIIDKCLMGLLANKTRILATHQLSLISAADRMIFMDNSGALDVGSLDELLNRNTAFADLMEMSKKTEAKRKEGKKAEEELELKKVKTLKDLKEVKITKDEEKAVNRIKLDVFTNYLEFGSGIFGKSYLPLLILTMTIATFLSIFTNNWLAYWQENRFPSLTSGAYIGIYVMLAVLSIVFLTLEYWMMVYLSNNAARNLNLHATKALLHVPMSYIDTTPMGRILNRFTKDTDVCDNEMIEDYRLFINPFCQIVGITILCICYLPWFAIAVPPLAVVYIAIAGYYQASAREVKRLEAVQRSFVFTHFGESLGGMDTIKAYGATTRFLDGLNTRIDNQNEAYFITISNQRFLAIHLDTVATAFSLVICLLCCFRVFNISAASTGLLLTYVLNMAGLLSLMLRAFTQIENQMNSVERLNSYAKALPQEAAYHKPETSPPPTWPEHGEIVFDDVYLRYRPELPYVLKGVDLKANPGERIGFCGRTGAGKSTIMQCLYRLTEFEGHIYIDGVDIKTLGLNELRSKLSIIPQEPVLFTGSIRSNLDPFEEKTDEELWDALRRAGLIEDAELQTTKKQVKGDDNMHKFHLDQFVEDEGTNFSLGERQLITLARALVRDAKILILDEATSSVDYSTDSKVQKTIAKEFSTCTILCIAHRLKTILDYDRIAVVSAGEIVELDTPIALYKNGGSFREMCDQSSIGIDDFKS